MHCCPNSNLMTRPRTKTCAPLPVLLGLLTLLPAPASAKPEPAGKVLLDGSVCVAMVSIFDSDNPIRAHEEPKPLVLFDQESLPSGIRSPYVEHAERTNLKIVAPLDKASFPRNIAPPEFRWEDQVCNLWRLTFQVPGWSKPLQVVTKRTQWRPDEATWEAIKAGGTDDWVGLSIRGCNTSGDAHKVYLDEVKFRISPHPTDPIIVYRMVTPLFHGFKTPDIYYREVSNTEMKMFLPSKSQYCTNCHVFPVSPTRPRQAPRMGIAVRRTFEQVRLLGIYDFGAQEGKTIQVNSFFMSWDLTNRRIATGIGGGITNRPPITLETQEFYVRIADIVIVDTDTKEVRPLPGAAKAEYMETFPAWSADSKTIVFSRATEYDDLPATVQYDLYRVPYNDGKGGEPSPVPGASHNGRSNFAARFSPDGKWMVYNQADNGSLVEPTADLWIVSTEEGAQPRELECNTRVATDSHHCWSSNSRWLLFTSKRHDGVFTRIYLTEIDEDGHASPPVELPTSGDTMMCYNVPEFLQSRPRIDPEDILLNVSTPEK